MATLSPDGYDDWLRTRPGCVHKVLREFVPNTRLIGRDGRTLFVIGGAECSDDECTNLELHDGGTLLVSAINPVEDYEGALAANERICPHEQENYR